SNGEQKELRDEIIDLGTRYGIVTPYTSYLALEEGQVSRRDTTFTMNEPPRPASGMGGFRKMSGPSAAPAPTPMPQAVTGVDAIQQSKAARAQQERVMLKDEDTRTDA